MSVIHDPVGIFALILAAFIIAWRCSDALRLNRAATLLALGVLASPDLLGIVEAGAALQVLGSIGTIYLFFSAGLGARSAGRNIGLPRIHLSALRAESLRIMVWAFAPALLGLATGLALSLSFIGSLAVGLFFASAGAGAALYEPNSLPQPTSAGGLPASVSLLVVFAALAISAVSSGAGARLVILSCGSACVLAALELALLPRLASLVLRRARRPDSARGWFSLLSVFVLAYIGGFFSVPEWFTAFIVGIALAGAAHERDSAELRIRIPGDAIFVSAAFFLMGVSLDFSAFPSASEAALTAAVLCLAGLASRVSVAALARRFLARHEQVFGLALPFSALSLAIAWIFFRDGLFGASLFAGAAFLTLLSGPLSRVALKRVSLASSSRGLSSPVSAAISIPSRILVALSKPVSIPQLLDLAALLHGADNHAPIFPLVVRSPSELDSIASAASESLLATAVMRLSDMKMPVLPLSVASENPALGILEASSAKQCDTILLGWNSQPRLAHAFFGSLIDRVVAESGALTLVSRTRFPWPSKQQLFAILPPGVETHSGFDAARRCVERIARASYAPITFLAQTQVQSAAAPSLGQKIVNFASWRDIPELLGRLAGTAASIVLFSAQPGNPSWNPAFERLPHLLAEKIPEANVAVLYMPLDLAPDEPVEPAAPEKSELEIAEVARNVDLEHSRAILAEAVRGGRVRVDMRGSAVAEAVYDLLFSSFQQGEKKDLQILADRCIDILQTQPIEMEPGVVLLHSQLDTISYPVVCFGANRGGYRLSALENPAQVIVLILVPARQGAEDHLRLLADIASLFRNNKLKERLLSANRPEDLLS